MVPAPFSGEPHRTMTKIEKGPESPEKQKIENLYQLLDFLEGEFGENVANKFFKPILEQRAQADRVLGYRAKEERIKRLKNTEVTPITVARLNHIIDAHLKSLEIDLRHPERLKENIKQEAEEMLNAMKNKEVVMDEAGIRVKEMEK